MQVRVWLVTVGVLLSGVFSAPLCAQQYTDALREGANEYQIWAGAASGDNPGIASITVNEPLTRAGFQYSRVMLASKSLALKYTIDAIPLALTNTQEVTSTCLPAPGSPNTLACQSTIARKTVYGGGASPIGMQLNFRRTRRLQPIANGTAGFLYFNRETPSTGASQFNFTFTLGTGVQWFITPSHSITFGYKFHHFSNAFIANLNPAVDSHFFYAGFSFHR
jgi:opacity protein-like surface antigen